MFGTAHDTKVSCMFLRNLDDLALLSVLLSSVSGSISVETMVFVDYYLNTIFVRWGVYFVTSNHYKLSQGSL